MDIHTTFGTDNPATAINKWIMWSAKAPTLVAIECRSKESKEILDYAKANIPHLVAIMQKYKLQCVYNIDDLVQRIMRAQPNPYYEKETLDYDQVAVFCYG